MAYEYSLDELAPHLGYVEADADSTAFQQTLILTALALIERLEHIAQTLRDICSTMATE